MSTHSGPNRAVILIQLSSHSLMNNKLKFQLVEMIIIALVYLVMFVNFSSNSITPHGLYIQIRVKTLEYPL